MHVQGAVENPYRHEQGDKACYRKYQGYHILYRLYLAANGELGDPDRISGTSA